MAYPHPAPFVRVSFGSPSLALDARRLQPFHCHSQPKSSSQWLEKSGILYVHIYLPATGLLQLAGPPPPKPPQSLVPRRGQLEGGQRWLAEGAGRKMGIPTQPKGGERHLSPPFKRQSLLEVSEIYQGNARKVSKPQLPSVHLSPLRWGRQSSQGRVCPRSRPTLSSNSLKQTWPWRSKGRMKGVTAGWALA